MSFPFILALTFYIVHCINTKILIIKSFLSFYTKNKNTDHKNKAAAVIILYKYSRNEDEIQL